MNLNFHEKFMFPYCYLYFIATAMYSQVSLTEYSIKH